MIKIKQQQRKRAQKEEIDYFREILFEKKNKK
jgi:hypothetical protein